MVQKCAPAGAHRGNRQAGAVSWRMAARVTEANASGSPTARAVSMAPWTVDMNACASAWTPSRRRKWPVATPFPAPTPASRSTRRNTRAPRRRFPGNHRQFGSQHRADAHGQRALADALGPILGIGGKPRQRILDVPIESGRAFTRLRAVPRHDRQHQLRLGRKMVMDTGLADMHPLGYVGIAESVVSTGGKQQLGLLDDLDGPGKAPDSWEFTVVTGGARCPGA